MSSRADASSAAPPSCWISSGGRSMISSRSAGAGAARCADDRRHQHLKQIAQGNSASVVPEAYCELMCVFLPLSGKTRYVP